MSPLRSHPAFRAAGWLVDQPGLQHFVYNAIYTFAPPEANTFAGCRLQTFSGDAEQLPEGYRSWSRSDR
jgi:hypothetical protein